MSIECLEYKEYKSGALDGFAKIYVTKWDLEISGCKIFTKGQQRWFSLPSREYKDEAGQTQYGSLVYIRTKEVSKQFGNTALQAIDKWRAENQSTSQEVQPERVTAPEDNGGGLPF